MQINVFPNFLEELIPVEIDHYQADDWSHKALHFRLNANDDVYTPIWMPFQERQNSPIYDQNQTKDNPLETRSINVVPKRKFKIVRDSFKADSVVHLAPDLPRN